jgi:hypothetical protein
VGTVTTRPQKITFGEMRASGMRDVPIYCRDYHRCGHHTKANADGWSDGVRSFLHPAEVQLHQMRPARCRDPAEVAAAPSGSNA